MTDHATWHAAVCAEPGCGHYVRCCAGCGLCAAHHKLEQAPAEKPEHDANLAGGGVLELKNEPDKPPIWDGMGLTLR